MNLALFQAGMCGTVHAHSAPLALLEVSFQMLPSNSSTRGGVPASCPRLALCDAV